jgi:predicted Fe-Mo cluster-binding NifX family protein
MKIAIVTDDGKTISQHFGRATKYAVIDIMEGKVISSELREKAGHHTFHQLEAHHQNGESHHHGRGMDAHSMDKHTRMVQSIHDCSVLLARGMGRGAKISMEQANIKTYQVDLHAIDEAVAALVDGKIDQYTHDQDCGDHGHHH